MAKDYVYAVTPLLIDALMERLDCNETSASNKTAQKLTANIVESPIQRVIILIFFPIRILSHSFSRFRAVTFHSHYKKHLYFSRDLVHRQIAMDAVAHLTLGVYGFGCEDALVHLLNHVWPNVFETSPHVIQRFIFACEGMRVSLGPNRVLQYCLQVGRGRAVRGGHFQPDGQGSTLD